MPILWWMWPIFVEGEQKLLMRRKCLRPYLECSIFGRPTYKTTAPIKHSYFMSWQKLGRLYQTARFCQYLLVDHFNRTSQILMLYFYFDGSPKVDQYKVQLVFLNFQLDISRSTTFSRVLFGRQTNFNPNTNFALHF